MDPDTAVTSLDLQRQQAAARAADRTSGDAAAADGAADGSAAPADDSRQHGAGPPAQPPALHLNVAGDCSSAHPA